MLIEQEKVPAGKSGIVHTRWATHGGPSDNNSHPHTCCSGEIVLVHNGIIENFQELKEVLQKKGHQFKSETDTEVVAHLFGEIYTGDIKETIVKILDLLEGSYVLSILSI
ncbi:MAG: glutamine--fructose-6-phosphate aminotransferase, partial [bacterium]